MSITILEFIRELNVEASRPRLEHTLCTFKSCAKCQAKFAKARERFHRHPLHRLRRLRPPVTDSRLRRICFAERGARQCR